MVAKIIVYGATSFTAQNLLPYLESHPDRDNFEFILGGRNAQKLEAVNEKLTKKREVVVCDLKNDEEVEKMVKKGDVVMNLAGPYRLHGGEAIVRACAKLGKHYVDLCGEVSWISTIILPKYHDLAKETKACVVPSCGFDSIPSDMVMYMAHRILQERHPEMRIAKSTSMFHIRGGISGGTAATAGVEAEVAAAGGRKGLGEWATTPERGRPTTRPKFWYHIPQLGKYGGVFLMYPYNRTIVRRSQYLSWTANSTSEKEKKAEPVYGTQMDYAECMRVGKGTWLSSIILSLIITISFGLFFASSFTRNIMKRFLPSSGSGPSQKDLEAGWVKVTNVSFSDSSPPVELRTTYKGHGDPGYLHTCYLLTESALALVLPPPPGTKLPPRAAEGGVLTSASALGGVLIERLQRTGKVQMESEIIRKAGPKKIE